MGESADDKPVSTYIAVKPEYIVAATVPVYRNEKLELYKNSDIAPDGCLYIDTPHPRGILRQPTMQDLNLDQYTLFLRKTDATGRVLLPATRDNTAAYATNVRDLTEARTLMAGFEEHSEKLRQIHQREAARASFSGASSASPGEKSGTKPTPSPRNHGP
jgi:hypothetical protein